MHYWVDVMEHYRSEESCIQNDVLVPISKTQILRISKKKLVF